ncbi:MAG: hypothetical protein ACYDB9_02025 [Gammaproteobacteria bacterium]
MSSGQSTLPAQSVTSGRSATRPFRFTPDSRKTIAKAFPVSVQRQEDGRIQRFIGQAEEELKRYIKTQETYSQDWKDWRGEREKRKNLITGLANACAAVNDALKLLDGIEYANEHNAKTALCDELSGIATHLEHIKGDAQVWFNKYGKTKRGRPPELLSMLTFHLACAYDPVAKGNAHGLQRVLDAVQSAYNLSRKKCHPGLPPLSLAGMRKQTQRRKRV